MVLNNDNDVIENARQMLSVWGVWLRSGGGQAFRLGYPHSSCFIHAGEPRGDRVVPSAYEEHGEAQTIERIMCWLKGFSPNVYRALECRYLDQRTIPGSLDRCGCSVSTYQKRCSDGEHLVAGVLAGRALTKTSV